MARQRRARGGLDAWPGYVDALSTLLMVVIFVLLVFVLAQGFLSAALTSRDRALDQLNRQAAELAEMLSLERGQAAELRQLLTRTGEDLRNALGAREALSAQLRGLGTERDRTAAEAGVLRTDRDRLAARLTDLEAAGAGAAQRLTGAEARLAEALARAEAATTDAARSLARLGEQGRDLATERARVAELTRGLGAERAARAETSGALETARLDLATLRRQQAEAAAQLAEARRQITALREAEAALDRTVRADRTTIEARLADIARLQGEAQRLLALRDAAERAAQAALARAGEEERRRQGVEGLAQESQRMSEAARAQIALLTAQLNELRGQIARLANALDASQSRDRENDAQVVNLRAQLNAALAQRVEELQRYRSEFFGRLREVLGERPDIRVVGDRFVFQSEVLFPPASAELSAAGAAQVRQLSQVLLSIAARIPNEVPWLLRVDGHADRNPIRSSRFATNWELSAARAIAVANLLIEAGLPANRLAAAAFSDNQPLDPSDTPEALARNRRIELRLTDR